MTSTNGSEPVDTGPRKPSTSKDPEVLAAEIEKTREDLAETLDAIADKVSPKRVAGRTKKKVADKVSDVTEQVKEKVAEQTGHAKEAAAGAKDRLSGGSEQVVPVDVGAAVPPLPPVTAVQADHLDLTTTPVSTGAPTPTSTFPTAPSAPPALTGPDVPREALAGAGIGLLLLLLLRRRRNRRRKAALAATFSGAVAAAGKAKAKSKGKGGRSGRGKR
ncbi:MAG: hypothetical protein JWN17_90 [Frankiales bacterium]|nr:hypothetical protein [Frankiales bacterium]